MNWSDLCNVEKTTFVIESQNKFRIYNAGVVDVNPRESYLKIEFRGVSDGLTINNLTTGDTYKYLDTTTLADSLVIDGIRSLKNGNSVFARTNKKLITLVPGWNEFEVSGASGFFRLTFDFRFTYL